MPLGAVNTLVLLLSSLQLVRRGRVPRAQYVWSSTGTFYYVLTGIHLLHVLVGTVLLLTVRRRSRERDSWSRIGRFVEGGGVYWHMVDLLWVVLFSLLYLVEVA